MDYFSETLTKGLFRRGFMEFHAASKKEAKKYVRNTLRRTFHIVSLKAL